MTEIETTGEGWEPSTAPGAPADVEIFQTQPQFLPGQIQEVA